LFLIKGYPAESSDPADRLRGSLSRWKPVRPAWVQPENGLGRGSPADCSEPSRSSNR
jgi:hypothetical protein